MERPASEDRVVVSAERLRGIAGAVVAEGKPLPHAAQTDLLGTKRGGLVVAVERNRGLILHRVAVVCARNWCRDAHDNECGDGRSKQHKLSHELFLPVSLSRTKTACP